ncbi:MAG: NAD-dependent epimerase/dehydratase family protein [Acidimicrobiia bacterium]
MTAPLVLVTGGAGFVGSHVVDALVTAGTRVRVLDVLHPAHGGKLDYLNPEAEYVFEDVRNARAVAGALEGVDAVSHQAAMVGLGVDFADVCDYVGNNDAGTAVVLLALHRRRFSGRIVLASSMAVYGEGAYTCPAHGAVRPAPRPAARLAAGSFEPPCPHCGEPLAPGPVGEEATPEPRNVYAATKLHQEHLCAAYAREHPGAVCTALRYHNVYGPRMPRDTPYAGVASIFRSALEAGRPPQVYEDGGQRRDFIHVADVARANVAALTCEEAASGAFNIATGQPRTVLEMAEALAAGFGSGAPPPEVTGGFRSGDVRHVHASPQRARDVLGFTAEVEFAAGMAEFAHAPLRHPPA